MSLFSKRKLRKSVVNNVFNKNEVIKEILMTKNENCPDWNFFSISNKDEYFVMNLPTEKQNIEGPFRFNQINGDFLAIYTDVINKEVRIKSNPFSEYKTTVERIYQIVREVYIHEPQMEVYKAASLPSSRECFITDQDNENNIYKIIKASSAKELFIKLKKEQE